MATHLDLEEQEQARPAEILLEAVRQSDHRDSILARARTRRGTAGAGRRRPGRQGRGDVRRARPTSQAGDADKAGRIFGDMKERFPGTVFTAQAGLLAARTSVREGPGRQRGSHARLGRRNAGTEVPDRKRACAWPNVLLDKEKKFDEALRQLDAATAVRISGAGRRPAQRRPACLRAMTRAEGRAPEGHAAASRARYRARKKTRAARKVQRLDLTPSGGADRRPHQTSSPTMPRCPASDTSRRSARRLRQ